MELDVPHRNKLQKGDKIWVKAIVTEQSSYRSAEAMVVETLVTDAKVQVVIERTPKYFQPGILFQAFVSLSSRFDLVRHVER